MQQSPSESLLYNSFHHTDLSRGCKCHIASVISIMNQRQCQKCLTWAEEEKDWTVAQRLKFSGKFCISFRNDDPKIWW